MKISEIAEFLGGKLKGPGDIEILRAARLDSASENELSFVEKRDFLDAAKQTSASCLIVPEGTEDLPCASIEVSRPKLAFAKAAALLHPRVELTGRHETSVIAESASVSARYVGAFVSIGENSVIGEGSEIRDGVKIGRNVAIGSDTLIHPNAVIYDGVTIGSRCTVHAGAVIGADGFGFVRDSDGYVQFPQIGRVIIEDDVEIGANTCIDRGSLGETRIGRGTKIDNLVQIAHNVSVGENTVIAALTGISGSAVIGNDVVIAGQVGISDHTKIHDGVILGARSAVFPGKIVRKGVWAGSPIVPADEYKRQNALIKGLERLKEEVKELKRKISGGG